MVYVTQHEMKETHYETLSIKEIEEACFCNALLFKQIKYVTRTTKLCNTYLVLVTAVSF